MASAELRKEMLSMQGQMEFLATVLKQQSVELQPVGTQLKRALEEARVTAAAAEERFMKLQGSLQALNWLAQTQPKDPQVVVDAFKGLQEKQKALTLVMEDSNTRAVMEQLQKVMGTPASPAARRLSTVQEAAEEDDQQQRQSVGGAAAGSHALPRTQESSPAVRIGQGSLDAAQ